MRTTRNFQLRIILSWTTGCGHLCMSEEKKIEQLSPARMSEREKSRQERAEDIAYTLNHAISCMTTDTIIQPLINTAGSTFFDKEIHIGCMTPHGHETHTPHTHLVSNPTLAQRTSHFFTEVRGKRFWQEAGHWFQGEVYGDVGGVIPTILIQRFAPSFMQDIRNTLEPMLGWAFKWGAEGSAKQWGKRQFLDDSSAEVQNKQKEIYEHEMQHLPQAFVWNVFAFPVGMIGQRVEMFKHGMGDKAGWGRIGKQKLIGAAISNGLLLGGRALWPSAFGGWDSFNSKNIIAPTTRVVGGLLGLDKEAIERGINKPHPQDTSSKWQAREDQRTENAVTKAISI